MSENQEQKPKSKLDLLPDKIKNDMHKLIAEGNKGRRVKKAIEDRWLKETDILPADIATYDSYIENHYEDIMKQLELARALVKSSQQDVQDMEKLNQNVMDEDVSLDNRKKALEDIFARVQRRLKFIEATQTSYPNPQYEQLIGAYLKEMRTIVEKIVNNKEALERDNSKMIQDQLENALYLLLNKILEIYKELHGDEGKLDDFKDRMLKHIPDILANFSAEDAKKRGKK